VALALGAAISSPGVGIAVAGAAELDGKTTRWIVPFDVGGGTDVRSRFHVPWLKKYLKSRVNIVIENKPGAGSISGTNLFYVNRTRGDELNMLSTGGSTNIAMLMQQPAVKFDFLDMIPIAGFPVGSVWYVSRDTGVKTVQSAFSQGKRIAGWEVDKATRDFINAAGYGRYFVHRTGHSIGTSVHANGANMDNLETRDDREIIPNTCFSVEPGIYLPEFGVRSEVNVLVRKGSAEVTGKIQREIVTV